MPSFEKIWGIFLILELESSISEKIRKYKNFFNIWTRKFHFQKYKGFFWVFFFFFFSFFGFGIKSVGSCFWKHKNFFNIRARTAFF